MKLSNKRLTLLRSLTTKKGRAKHSSFLATGTRIIDEAIKSGQSVQYLAVAQSELTETGRKFLDTNKSLQVFEIAAKDLMHIDSSNSTQGVLAVISMIPTMKSSNELKSDSLLALDSISDPSNLGAIVRSALAFSFGGIILGEGCAELVSPKVIRASAGSIFHLGVMVGADLTREIGNLKARGYSVLGTDSTGSDVQVVRTKTKRRVCLVIGSEARGMSPAVSALCDNVMSIPITEKCDSLSAPVAAGVAMYEIAKWSAAAVKRRNLRRRRP